MRILPNLPRPKHRFLPVVLVAVLASICPEVRAAVAANSALPGFYLEVDGVACGTVQKCDGGDLRTTAVVESARSTDTGFPMKHPASPPAFAPLVIVVGFPLPQPIVDWMGDLCANRTTKKTVRLIETDSANAVRGGTEWSDTALIGVDLPALDASDKSDALVTLTLMPGSSQAIPGGGTVGPAVSSPSSIGGNVTVQCFDFALAIDGLDTSRVSRIEALSIRRTAAPATEFSNLVVSTTRINASTWQAWFDDFVLKGNSGDAQERSGTLSLFDSTRTQTVLSLQFSHLGITRLSPPTFLAGSSKIIRDQAEFYFEAMSLTAGGAATGNSSSGASTTPGSLTTPPPIKGTAPLGTTPVAPGPAAGSSPSTITGATGTPPLSTPVPGKAMAVTPVPTIAGTSPTLTTLPTSPAATSAISPVPRLPTALPPMPSVPGVSPALTPLPPSPGAAIAPGSAPPVSPAAPIPSSASPAILASPTAAPGTVTSAPAFTPAAIATFPVLNSAVRTSFSSTRGKASWQERANYTAALTPENAVSTYTPQLSAAGWTEISRSESGDAAAHTLQFTLDLQQGQTRAHVVLAQNAQGGTNVAVAVTTEFPGNSAPSLATGATAAPATGATASPADRGARDPANFPRLAGSVRTSFSSTTQPTSTHEVATYTAKCAPAAADAFYAQNLLAPDWDEISRYENVDDVAKSDQISMTWQNLTRAALITLTGSTLGGTEVRLTINTAKP